MTTTDVRDILSHRPPFLFVQKILSLTPGSSASALSNTPARDLQALGCPDESVPLWYAAEFLAQTGALAVLAGRGQEEKTLMTGLDGFLLHRQASARQPLRAEVTLLGERRGIGKRQGSVWQGEHLIAEGTVWYARTR